MEKRILFINAIMTAIHMVVNAAILFMLYKFALSVLGVERLGVWSLLLATASASTVFQLAYTTSVVRFVAKYIALEDKVAVAKIIETSLTTVGLFHGVFLVCLYPVIKFALGYLMDGQHLAEGIGAIPPVLTALWLFLVGYVYQSALDGYQLNALRKLLLVVAGLVQLALAYVLIPRHGVIGLAYAQIAQNLVVLIGSGGLLKRQLPILHIIPRRWSPTTFREMFHYSMGLQAMSFCQMIIDPITKSLITKFGGLAMTGYYDLAFRMVFQVRGMLVASTEVLLPAVATLMETNRGMISRVYSDTYALIIFISVPCYTLLILSTPLISRIWIGSYQTAFIEMSTIIALGLFFNTISSPAWIVQIGISRLKWVVIASAILAALNIVLGFCLGWLFGGKYVVVAFAISHIASGMALIIAYQRENGIPLISLMAAEHFSLFVGAVFALSFNYGIYRVGYGHLNLKPIELDLLIIGVGLIVVSIPAWVHPVRKRLTTYAASQLTRRRRLQEKT
jgi:O-antigen/teichoic acid export membrane protein